MDQLRKVGMFRSFTSGALGAGLAIGMALMIYLGTSAAQQPAAGQAPSPAASGQPAGAASATVTAAPGRRGGGGFREPDPIAFDDHTGYVQIFDGTSLKGWDGDPSVWRVEDGAIIGESTKEHPAHTYIVYRPMEAKDFDLKFEIKVEGGGGSGIQYRSKTGIPWRAAGRGSEPPTVNLDWMMTGPQADYWFPVRPSAAVWTGQFYSENTPMGILAWRGQVVEMVPGSAQRLVGNIGDRQALGGYVRVNDWNQYLVMARGGTFIHVLNGQLMSVLVDDDATDSNNQPGMIGIEIEGFPSKVSVRNIWIRKLS